MVLTSFLRCEDLIPEAWEEAVDPLPGVDPELVALGARLWIPKHSGSVHDKQHVLERFRDSFKLQGKQK